MNDVEIIVGGGNRKSKKLWSKEEIENKIAPLTSLISKKKLKTVLGLVWLE